MLQRTAADEAKALERIRQVIYLLLAVNTGTGRVERDMGQLTKYVSSANGGAEGDEVWPALYAALCAGGPEREESLFAKCDATQDFLFTPYSRECSRLANVTGHIEFARTWAKSKTPIRGMKALSCQCGTASGVTRASSARRRRKQQAALPATAGMPSRMRLRRPLPHRLRPEFSTSGNGRSKSSGPRGVATSHGLDSRKVRLSSGRTVLFPSGMPESRGSSR